MEHCSSQTICVEDASNNGLVTNTNGDLDLEHCSRSTSPVEQCSTVGVGSGGQKDGMEHCSSQTICVEDASNNGLVTNTNGDVDLEHCS